MAMVQPLQSANLRQWKLKRCFKDREIPLFLHFPLQEYPSLSAGGTFILQQHLGSGCSQQITRTCSSWWWVSNCTVPLLEDTPARGVPSYSHGYGPYFLQKLTDSETLRHERLRPKLLLQCQSPPDPPKETRGKARRTDMHSSCSWINKQQMQSFKPESDVNTKSPSVTHQPELSAHCEQIRELASPGTSDPPTEIKMRRDTNHLKGSIYLHLSHSHSRLLQQLKFAIALSLGTPVCSLKFFTKWERSQPVCFLSVLQVLSWGRDSLHTAELLDCFHQKDQTFGFFC